MLKIGRRAAIVALCATGALAGAASAEAAGAFAFGIKDNDAGKGLAWGYSYNYDHEGDAKYEALSQCLAFTDAPADVRAMCKVATTYKSRCFAVSMDPKPGTPGWGWATDSDKGAAERQAVENCKSIAGSDRTSYCEVSASTCDKK